MGSRQVVGRQEVDRLAADGLLSHDSEHEATILHQQRYIPSLDGIRALAIIGIIAFHFAAQSLPGGFIGIVIFFVLSGFLTTRGVVHRYLTNEFSYLSYLGHRLLRIVPEMAAVILMCSSLTLIVGADSGVGLGKQVLAAFTFSTNWVLLASGNEYFDQDSPSLFRNMWFLGPEMQLCVLWPIILIALLLVLSRTRLPANLEHAPRDMMRFVIRPTAVITAVLACVSGVLMAVFVSLYGIDRVYYGTDTQAFGFLLGACVALALGDNQTASIEVRRFGWLASAKRVTRQLGAAVGLVALCAVMFMLQGTDIATYRGWLQTIALLTALVIAALATSTGPVSAVLACRPLRYIASRSYALYLWHWPIMVLAINYAPYRPQDSLGFILAVIALSVAAAELSHWWIAWPIGVLHSRVAQTSTTSLPQGIATTSNPVATDSHHDVVFPEGSDVEGSDVHSSVALGTNMRAHKILAISISTLCCLALTATTVKAIAVSPSETLAQERVNEGQAAIEGNSMEKTQLPEPSEPSPSPTQTAAAKPATITGDQITGVGDSVMLGSAQALIARFPGIDIDAKVSRQPWDVPGIIDNKSKSGRLRDVVLIGIGTNGTLTPDILAHIRSILIILVNAYAERSWISTSNNSIEDFVANDPNAVMVDWYDTISAHKDYLAPDRIHPDARGSGLYADLIYTVLREAAARR